MVFRLAKISKLAFLKPVARIGFIFDFFFFFFLMFLVLEMGEGFC